jgi:hypothetical protein
VKNHLAARTFLGTSQKIVWQSVLFQVRAKKSSGSAYFFRYELKNRLARRTFLGTSQKIVWQSVLF